MASPCDPETRTKILEALQSSEHARDLRWKSSAAEKLQAESRGTIQVFAVNRALRLAVEGGCKIDAVVETREDHKLGYSHHYDVRLRLPSYRVYVEMILIEEKRSAPELRVVSAHWTERRD